MRLFYWVKFQADVICNNRHRIFTSTFFIIQNRKSNLTIEFSYLPKCNSSVVEFVCLCFFFWLCSSIGYGSLTPKTVEGKIVTMAYAMIGVPLMLMCLSNLGRVLAESVRQTYARLCIRQSDHYKCTTEDGSGGCSGSPGDTYQSAEEKNEVTTFKIIMILLNTIFFLSLSIRLFLFSLFV